MRNVAAATSIDARVVEKVSGPFPTPFLVTFVGVGFDASRYEHYAVFVRADLQPAAGALFGAVDLLRLAPRQKFSATTWLVSTLALLGSKSHTASRDRTADSNSRNHRP
jgi:hypothetical protein